MSMAGSTLPILTFHALENQHSAVSFPQALFREGIARLRENNYSAISLSEAVQLLRGGGNLPARTLVITFDDGYHSIYQIAFPVLMEHEMVATVFLTVGESHVEAPDKRLAQFNGRQMLSWNEIREMQDAGFDFGAHTLTHPDLTQLSAERIEAEMRDSKAIIEDALGIAADSFAYPYGRHNRQVREIAGQYFACACGTFLDTITPNSNPYALERVEMYYFRSPMLFDVLNSPLLRPYLMARRIPRRLRYTVRGHGQ